MANGRRQVSEYYAARRPGPITTLARALAPPDRYAFRGNKIELAIVVRVDLNGYSEWARGHQIGERAALLDDFFSQLVPLAERFDGAYFRDEGDCLVCLFSPYFGAFDSQNALEFCKSAARGTFGPDRLTAKVSVAATDVAFFQKAHEAGTDDWSVEGEAFVRAARLEQVIPSKSRVYVYALEYWALFSPRAPVVSVGGMYYWSVNPESIRVPGLSLPGAWIDVVWLEHVPEGRVQE